METLEEMHGLQNARGRWNSISTAAFITSRKTKMSVLNHKTSVLKDESRQLHVISKSPIDVIWLVCEEVSMEFVQYIHSDTDTQADRHTYRPAGRQAYRRTSTNTLTHP